MVRRSRLCRPEQNPAKDRQNSDASRGARPADRNSGGGAMTLSRRDAINGALERLADVGFHMEHFSEHGPMVAEAISAMGRNDAVVPWVDIYKAKRRHNPTPPPRMA